MNNNRKILGRRIKKARLMCGLNQLALGSILGKSQGAISHWESGTDAINVDDLREIAKITNKPIEWFFQVEESKDSESTIKRNLEIGQKTNYNLNEKYDNMLSSENDRGDVMEGSSSSDKIGFLLEKLVEQNSKVIEQNEKILELNKEQIKQNKEQLEHLVVVEKNLQESERIAEEAAKLAEINYMLEVGEISEQQASLRMKKIRKNT
ncbi:MAG: helix-turn-helix domain-containing protein [Vulcanimicrobiota bacterium]